MGRDMPQLKIVIPFYHHIKEKRSYKKVSIFHIMSKNVSHRLDSRVDRKTGKRVYRRFPNDNYTRLLKEICIMIRSKGIKFHVPDKPIANEIILTYTVYKPTHNGDSFNLLDGLADAVKEVIGIDDRYFACGGITTVIEKNNPRIELIICQNQ